MSERQPVGMTSFVEGSWLGTAPRAWPGATGAAYRADIRESDPIYAREGLGHPGLLQRVMNWLLVDNVDPRAVDPCRQPDADPVACCSRTTKSPRGPR